MKISELRKKGRDALSFFAGLEEPDYLEPSLIEHEVDLLLCECLGVNKAKLLISLEDESTLEVKEKFLEFVERRKTHEPLAYILGSQEFYGLNFLVSPDVLIPRPDTEILVEAAIKFCRNNSVKRVLDIGTGSGAVIISIAKELAENKEIEFVSIDVSKSALELARKNAKLNGLENIEFLNSSAFNKENYKEETLVVSNPPYIAPTEVLPKSVRDFEPSLALIAKDDGLEFYKEIIRNSSASKLPVLFEVGMNQAESVAGLLKQAGYTEVSVLNDLQGHNRVVFGVG